jgi:hypothetical protein
MDHPDNLRHPTTWHARDYGLFAANPFGLHDFLGQPPGSGDLILSRNKPIVFRYRVLLATEFLEADTIEKLFNDFAAAPLGNATDASNSATTEKE